MWLWFLGGWSLGAATAWSACSSLAHRRMAEGWHYLAMIARRRPINGIDPLVAFSDDREATALRRAVLDDQEVS